MSGTAKLAPETDEKKSRGLGSYVVWAFVAAMVYVLSSGPAFGLKLFRYVGICRFYEPLTWVYWNTALQKPLGLYWHLWTADFNGQGDWIGFH